MDGGYNAREARTAKIAGGNYWKFICQKQIRIDRLRIRIHTYT